jgi:sugar phosphate isomerase/epimerase
MVETRLTYCGNVHPSETLDGWLGATESFALPVARARRAAGARFGLGAWWTAEVARRLASEAPLRARVRARLAELGLELWTLNVFPFGGFHAEVVKDAVYRPDWADPRRLAYTVDAAAAACDLAPDGALLPLSTLPLGYGDGDRPAMAGALRRCAVEFAEIELRTGRRPVLALEPEPFCLEETAAGLADFLEDGVFRGAGDEALLRRHLGVCLDLCHLEVVGEDPVRALDGLRRRGIEVPKVQVSSGLELRDPAGGLDRLLAFDEPRYLHQTVADDGTRAADLAEVRARRDEFARAGRLRTHFHLPVFWDDPGPLGSTRAGMDRFLREAGGPLPLLEVETYTWTVLDPAWRPERDLVAGIVRELEHVSARIAERR